MSMKINQEQDAIDAVLRGDTDRFAQLVRAREAGIYRFCLRMLGNPQDALDASQEVFLRAWRGLGSFRGQSRFSTWLYRLAGNVCADFLRRRPAPLLSLEEDGAVPELPAPGASPQEALERRELGRAVRRALGELPPDFRQAVVLRDACELTYEEIAEVTGLTVGTVKTRIYRGRRRLAAALMEDRNFAELYPPAGGTARERGSWA